MYKHRFAALAAVVSMTLLFAFLMTVPKFFYGTFLIDHATLLVVPYFITYWLFNPKGFNQWFMRRVNSPAARTALLYIEVAAAPLTIVAMWVGGVLPFFGFIPPEAVYAGAFPAEWLGVTGQDFMWNGFLLAFDVRIVPLSLAQGTPPWPLLAYAVVYWLSMVPVFFWSVLRARRMTMFPRGGRFEYFLWRDRAMILLLGLAALLLDVVLAAGVAYLTLL